MAAISNTSASTSASASAFIRQRQTSALSPGKKPDEQEIRQMASEINRTGDRPLWFDDRDERMQAFARQAAQLPADARPQLLKEIIDQRPDAIHDWVGAQRLEQLAGAGRISAEEKAAVQSTVAAAYTEGRITHAQMQTIMGVASMPPGHNPARFETARSFLTGNAPEMAGARAKFLRDSFAAHVERAANGYGGRPDFNSALALTLMQSGGQQSDVARIFSKLTPAEQSLAAAGVGAAAVGYRYSQPHVNGLTDPWAVLHRAVVQANPPATRQGQLQLTRMAEGLASSGRYATPESDKAVTDLYAQVAEGRARQKMDDPQAMAEGLARVANAESRAAGVLKTLPPDASAEQIWQAIQKNPGAFTDPVFVQYLELRGDQARHLQGSDLRNDIGLALGLPVTQTPANEVQQARMERGELDFFNVNAADEAGQAIRSIEAQIQKAGGESARVAALPVTVASKEHGLIQTVIWRVETADGQEKFVDYNPATQEARTYASFEDWKNNNQLPPSEMTYARNGHLTAGVDGKPQLETGNTPNTVDIAWEAWIKPALDGAALVGSVVLLGAAVVGTGGTAVMVGGALLGAYGAGTGGVELADRAAHGQTLSLGNAQARNAWLNVGASALSLGTMGASMRLANMSGRATGNAIDEAVQLTRMAQTARGLNVAAQYADTAAFADGGLMLAANWDRMTPAERTQALAMMAFWSAGTAVSARQAGGVKNLYVIKTATVTAYRVDSNNHDRRILSDGTVPVVKTSKGKERSLFINFNQRERAISFALENRNGQATITMMEVKLSLLEELRKTAVHDLHDTNPEAPLRVDVSKAPDQFGLRTSKQIQIFRESIIKESVKVIAPEDLLRAKSNTEKTAETELLLAELRTSRGPQVLSSTCVLPFLSDGVFCAPQQNDRNHEKFLEKK